MKKYIVPKGETNLSLDVVMEEPLYEDYGPYNVLTLRRQYNQGQHLDFLFFWGHTQKGQEIDKSCLSQWYPCTFTVDGETYNCAEQYMMAEKAYLFRDLTTREKILNASDPAEIKALGREVKNFDASTWQAYSYDIVLRGNRAKFSQNPELKRFLLATKGMYLVEASPYDKIWGIGMRSSEKAKNPNNWLGTNKLGFALTQVREELLNDTSYDERDEDSKGIAIIFAGGSASGKSTLIRKMGEGYEVLSTDTYGENQIEVHNNAQHYAEVDPDRLSEAEMVIRNGMHTRFPDKKLLNKVQNIVLDFNSTTVSPSSVSALLSIGAHKTKEKYFKSRIDVCAENRRNLILDMTGKEREVKLYTEYLKEKGFRVHLYWVIASRSQALIWNAMRPRCMKISGVHSGHIGPNSYLLDAIQDSRSMDWEKVVLKFNSTDDIHKPIDDNDKAEIVLEKGEHGFVVNNALAERIKSVLGPLEAAAYISQRWIKQFFLRYRMMKAVANAYHVECPQITDLLVSLLNKDKKGNEINIKQFYNTLGISEPALPERPLECYDVNVPIRQQFLLDEDFYEACQLYPKHKALHVQALKQWAEYEYALDNPLTLTDRDVKATTTKDMKSRHITYNYDFSLYPASKYKKHVEELDDSIRMAESVDVSNLTSFFDRVKSEHCTICFYGAGGAMSPVTFASQLAMSVGIVAMALTPLEVLNLTDTIVKNMRFVALTASGKPADMQAATEYLLKIAPERVFCITTSDLNHKDRWGRLDNHVGLLMQRYAPAENAVTVNLDIHSDGYVGTRKHVCTALLLYRAFYPEENNFVEKLIESDQSPFTLRMPTNMTMKEITDLHILYGALGHAAANDLEGRLLECGVLPAMCTDFKNFTHGRHTYINTRPTSTLLFLVAPQDEKFVAKMLKTIPAERPVIMIRTNRTDLLGALQLMICTFYLGVDLGYAKGVNMHSPGTPDWGVKLWGMKLSDCYNV